MQEVNFSLQANLFLSEKSSELNTLFIERTLMKDKLALLKMCVLYLQKEDENSAKKYAQKYSKDSIFKKLFEVFNVTL